MKYAFDLIVSILGLIILSPLFAVLALLIKLEDRGPVFFQHTRVGKGGRLFKLYKFRSMHLVESGNEGSFEPGNTARVTSVGMFIRRKKLDELPQLINVIRGDMSLVGPRPEINKWVSAFPEKWNVILTVRPGITDVASLEYRNEETILAEAEDPERMYREVILPKKLELCEKYVLKHSFADDLSILVRTMMLFLPGKNHYTPDHGSY